MKIGIFDPYLDTLGGGEKYILTAASCLSKSHEVYLFWDNKETIEQGRQKFEINLDKVSLAENIFNHNISFKKRLLLSRQYAAIFYLSDGSIPFVLGKLFVHFQFPVKKQKEILLLQKIKLRRISKVICNSNYTKEYIDKEFGIKSVVLYPPVDEIKEKTSVEKEDLIITVGRYNKLSDNTSFKKHEFLIEAFKKLPKDKYEFMIVTSKEKKDEKHVQNLREMAKGYRITILENAMKKDLDLLYPKAKVYWHAAGFNEDLVKYPERAEHFGITTVEAMLRGVVPVVFAAGGQKEIVEDKKSGFLFNTEKELLKKTEMLMKDDKLREQMANETKIRARFFSGNRFCRELLEIIK